MKKKTPALTFILLICISLASCIQMNKVAKANFFPGDALMIFPPIPGKVYDNTSVPLQIVATIANPTPEIVNITYRLDEGSNITLTDLNKILRQPGHIDGSQFSVETVMENLSEGKHTLTAYSQDTMGKQMSAVVEFIIDTNFTTPLALLSPQNKTYTTTEIPLTFLCRENGPRDLNFSYAAYQLDGIGSSYICDNVTLTELPLGSHTIILSIWTENRFYSETIQFSISAPEAFPTTTVAIASAAALSLLAVALLVYFKKRKR
jgi:hypothetical protein